MTDRQVLIDQLIEHDEGCRLKPYPDTRGKLTIGWGHNLTDDGITAAQALRLLNDDIDAVILDLSNFPWFVALDPVRQCAVIDARFNLGHGGFSLFTKFIHAMAVSDYPTAADELRNSQAAKQAPSRYAALALMIETGTE